MITTPAERVATEIRAHLARQRKTQAQIAGHLGISQQAVSRRMSGAQPFDVDELHRVAAFLDVPVASLLGTDAAAGAA